MKKIKFPQPIVVGDKKTTAEEVVEDIILARPEWRSNRDKIRAFRVIWEAWEQMRDTDERQLVLPDDAHEQLMQVSRLEGMVYSPPKMNRFIGRVVESIFDGETTEVASSKDKT